MPSRMSIDTEAYLKNFPSNELTDLDGGASAGMSNKGYSRELNMASWFTVLTMTYGSLPI